LENIYLLIYVRDLLIFGDRVKAGRVLFTECNLRDCPPERVLRMLGRLIIPPRA
jgi:hypothetical protein